MASLFNRVSRTGVRDLILLPGVPRRALDDLREMKELVRELLDVTVDLTETSRSTDRKVAAIGQTNQKLDLALEELRTLNGQIERLDSRIERLDHEVRLIRTAVADLAETLPNLSRGPLERAKDALTGE